MITLYHCISARSFRPLWALEELALPYKLHLLPFPPRILSRSYLDINPLGTIPLLLDDGVRMTESAAICQYLAVKYGAGSLNVTPEEPDFGAYLNWLHFGEATLTFPQTLVLRYGKFEPPARRLPQVEGDYRKWFLSRLRALDTVLAASETLCANRFTAADISVGYALMLADYLGMTPQFSASVRAYWERLQGRPGYQRALEVQHNAALAEGISPVPAPLAGD